MTFSRQSPRRRSRGRAHLFQDADAVSHEQRDDDRDESEQAGGEADEDQEAEGEDRGHRAAGPRQGSPSGEAEGDSGKQCAGATGRAWWWVWLGLGMLVVGAIPIASLFFIPAPKE